MRNRHFSLLIHRGARKVRIEEKMGNSSASFPPDPLCVLSVLCVENPGGRLMASWRFDSAVAMRSTIPAEQFPVLEEKFPVLEEKFPILEEKLSVLEEKRFFSGEAASSGEEPVLSVLSVLCVLCGETAASTSSQQKAVFLPDF